MRDPDPRVGEIEARLEAATPGPWFLDADGVSIYYVFHNGDTLDRDRLAESGGTDATLIASAPADVAYLLAELRARDEALARMSDAAGRVEGLCLYWDGLADGDKYYASRVRAAVAGWTGGRG